MTPSPSGPNRRSIRRATRSAARLTHPTVFKTQTSFRVPTRPSGRT